MKAPDKIYIQTHKGETLSSKWTTIPFRDFENEEYIRKGALLEWAKQVIDDEQVKKRINDGDKEAVGYIKATEDLINDFEL